MNTEIQYLVYAVLLGFAQLFIASGASTLDRGLKWNWGPRDDGGRPLRPHAARADRAFQNFKETFPFFVAAVLAVLLANGADELSARGCMLYLVGRVIYIPLYIFGVNGVRTLAWFASVIGIFMVLASVWL